ncbi:hypothetical protein DYBT9623_04466 [Dyadobacter sp. CECT 9623]|uniref:HTH cro/C1-type domain-containing protein n=1 Tax=Dyadobacter linearis TaxID=2823330 RepID=A0ABN7RER3_9BACT|nr:hypothetical protein [Dyadobacter sp. CECT 9623]CAG5072929.1 hypothetical protein DYBT9623_04466 [Dyadobacter sp. CECT 9623]
MKEQEKFEKLIDALGVTVYQFGKDLGFARVEPIYKITRGDTKDPGVSIYGKIKKAYPKVNLEWLVTGEGSIFVDESQKEESELSSRVQQLESEKRLLKEMYEQAVISKAASLGKSKDAAMSSPERDRILRKDAARQAIRNVRRGGRKEATKPLSGRVQGATVPSLLELFE